MEINDLLHASLACLTNTALYYWLALIHEALVYLQLSFDTEIHPTYKKVRAITLNRRIRQSFVNYYLNTRAIYDSNTLVTQISICYTQSRYLNDSFNGQNASDLRMYGKNTIEEGTRTTVN